MQNIHNSPIFSSIDALKHADVRPSSLAEKGKISVGGQVYQVRLLPSGHYKVNRDHGSEKKSFFNSATELIRNRLSAGSLSSKSSRIENTLNEKRSPAEKAGLFSSHPLHIPPKATGKQKMNDVQPSATPPRFGGLNFFRGEKAGSSGTKMEPQIKQSLNTLMKLASAKLQKKPYLNVHDIAMMMSSKYPQGLQKLNDQQIRAAVNKMAQLCQKYEGRLAICSQFTDGVASPVPYSQTAHHLFNKAKTGHIRIVRLKDKLPSSRAPARITINVKPEYAAKLGKALADIVADTPKIEAKLVGFTHQGQRTESGIIYMQPNYKQAQVLTEKLKERIPPDAFVSHHTIGMHPMETGFNYAELSTQDHEVAKGSYCNSRATVIHDAIHDSSSASRNDKMMSAFVKHGYNAENPAFLATSAVPKD